MGWKSARRIRRLRRRAQVLVDFGLDLRQVVLLDGAALGAEAEAVVLDFEEGDGVALPGQGLVEDEDARSSRRSRD